MPERLRLVVMGTTGFVLPGLDALLGAGHEVAAVYTQPPRPAGRGHRLRRTPVHDHTEALGLPVRTPRTLKDAQAQAEFAALEADLAIVGAYGLLLPRPVLDAPRLGCINLHASLLPRWRGAAPVARAIMAGDRETGVMVMQMDEGLDTGPVAMAERVAIGADTTAGELADRLARQAHRFGVETLQAQEVVGLRAEEESRYVTTGDGQEYGARAVLLATGSTYRRLGVRGEDELLGAGIHFCATCDGPFYRASRWRWWEAATARARKASS